jgi:hypothetical protein
MGLDQPAQAGPLTAPQVATGLVWGYVVFFVARRLTRWSVWGPGICTRSATKQIAASEPHVFRWWNGVSHECLVFGSLFSQFLMLGS